MHQVLECVGANNSILYFVKNYEGTTPSGKILPEKYNSLSKGFFIGLLYKWMMNMNMDIVQDG